MALKDEDPILQKLILAAFIVAVYGLGFSSLINRDSVEEKLTSTAY
jgi:hypothetical protein